MLLMAYENKNNFHGAFKIIRTLLLNASVDSFISYHKYLHYFIFKLKQILIRQRSYN